MDRRTMTIVTASLLLGAAGWMHDRVAISGDESAPATIRPPERGTRIAIIDIAKVFQESNEYKTGREKLKADIDRADADARLLAAEAQQIQEKLKQLKEGSDEYETATAALVIKSQAFESFRKINTRNFERSEAKLYAAVYQLSKKHIRKYAEAHRIDLVTRFQQEPAGDPIDVDPKKVPSLLNQAVLYHDNLDITDQIIQAMNGAVASAAPISP